MSEVAISIDGVSKCYRVRHQAGQAGRYVALRDVMAQKAKGLLSGSWKRGGSEDEEFWALRDVSFEVGRGEKIGIVGRNGAGKSTLLKILSRITEPSRGMIVVNGSVASLLEVGTGFHPELTGRENIYLNGAILGMSRREIQKKFDEIVQFAEIEKFLDTPVKRYSSGMYVRLAFSVAAHVEPDILVVDEVLAVGDVQFQKKCMGKMNELGGGGRTVLFVSHNMAAIRQLTNKAVLLEKGQLALLSDSEAVVDRYLCMGQSLGSDYDVSSIRECNIGRPARFIRLCFSGEKPVFEQSDSMDFFADILAEEDVLGARISMTVFSNNGTPVGSGFGPPFVDLFAGSVNRVQVVMPCNYLAPGKYYIGLAVGLGDNKTGFSDFDIVNDVLNFEILPGVNPDGTLQQWFGWWGGVVIPVLENRTVGTDRI